MKVRNLLLKPKCDQTVMLQKNSNKQQRTLSLSVMTFAFLY